MKYVLGLVIGCFLCAATTVRAQVIINEVYPNPMGSSEPDEWIELYNPSDHTVQMAGWTIEDTHGKIMVYPIPDQSLESKKYLVLDKENTGITLNNSGGEGLVLKNGQIVADSLEFGEIAELSSWGRANDGESNWQLFNSPTKGAANSTAPVQADTPTPTMEIPRIQIIQAEPYPKTGDNEWVELKNESQQAVTLADWKVVNQTGRSKPVNLTIPEKGTGRVAWTSGFLNNAGSTIQLINPSGSVVDTLTIGACVTPHPAPTTTPLPASPTSVIPKTIPTITSLPTLKKPVALPKNASSAGEPRMVVGTVAGIMQATTAATAVKAMGEIEDYTTNQPLGMILLGAGVSAIITGSYSLVKKHAT